MLNADISGLSPEQAQIEFTVYWLEMNASVLSLASQSLTLKQKFFKSIQNATEGYEIRSMSFTDYEAIFNSWLVETNWPWKNYPHTGELPLAWGREQLTSRFCDWWTYVHVNGFWFLGGGSDG